MDRFVELMDKRKAKIYGHFGNQMKDKLFIPSERAWYNKHIFPIDKQIIREGNEVLRILGLHIRYKSLSEVYASDILKDYYDQHKDDEEKE